MANPIPTVQARFGQEEDLLKSRQQDGVDAVGLDKKSVWRFIKDIGWVQLAGPGNFNLVVTAVLPLALGTSAASLGKMTIPGGRMGPRGFVHTTLIGTSGHPTLSQDLTVTSISPGETRNETFTLPAIVSPAKWLYEAIYQNRSEAGGGNQNVTYDLRSDAGAGAFETTQITVDTSHDWVLEYRVSVSVTPASIIQALVEEGYLP